MSLGKRIYVELSYCSLCICWPFYHFRIGMGYLTVNFPDSAEFILPLLKKFDLKFFGVGGEKYGPWSIRIIDTLLYIYFSGRSSLLGEKHSSKLQFSCIWGLTNTNFSNKQNFNCNGISELYKCITLFYLKYITAKLKLLGDSVTFFHVVIQKYSPLLLIS